MSLTIALDAMGGDRAPGIVVDGAARALGQPPDLASCCSATWRGVEPLLRPARAARRATTRPRHTPDFVAGDAKPSMALRQGRNSSMRLAINAVKEGEAAAAVSAGNTGALMAMAKFVLKTLPGIDRPAIASVLPGRGSARSSCSTSAPTSNATPRTCSSSRSWAKSSRASCWACAKPRVGLLNVGTEELKGDDVVRGAAAMLRDSRLPIDFHGFVEGDDVTEGVVDVVVTDGFTGNVALKIAEGTAAMFTAALRDAIRGGGWRAKLGYLFARPALRRCCATGSTRAATTARCSSASTASW